VGLVRTAKAPKAFALDSISGVLYAAVYKMTGTCRVTESARKAFRKVSPLMPGM